MLNWPRLCLTLMVVIFGAASWIARGAQRGVASGVGAATVVVGHDYDPISDTVVSWKLKAGESVGQSFTVPSSSTLQGFRVKLLRVGSVSPLEYRIGDKWGDNKVASGRILQGDVSRFFERWTEIKFDRPVTVNAHKQFYMQLRVLNSVDAGHYEFFGTASERIGQPNFNIRFQYAPAWGNAPSATSTFENASNLDYGARTPRYGGGTAIATNGTPIQPLDFAFQILGQTPTRSTPSDTPSSLSKQEREETDSPQERFAFIEELIAPLHEKLIRVSDTPRSNEFELTDAWSLFYPSNDAGLVSAAVADFQKFLTSGMGVKARAQPVSSLESTKTSSKSVLVGTRRDLPWVTEVPSQSEAFLVKVSSDQILVCGFDERGVMRALQYLEDRLSFRRAPILEPFREVRAPLYSPRITSTPFYARVELEEGSDPYSDELLSRISHYGFSAIWIWAELFEVGRSSAFPELENNVEARQRRLKAVVDRAERRGLDVYLYLANRPQPNAFFETRLGERGSPLKAYGGDYVLCTSAPEAQRFIREATQDLFQRVPSLRGVVFIVGGEGFMHCYTRKLDCPRCSRRSPQEVVAELATTIDGGARAGRSDADVALWPYSASNPFSWSKDDPNQSRLLERLPSTVTLLTEFGKEGRIQFGGITIPAYDYPINYVGPSERFSSQAELTRQLGLNLWVKTEHAIAMEFIQTPYIPVYFQWAERFRRFQKFPGLKGVFANWLHFGFMPSIAAEVFKWHTWSPLPETENLLRRIARREFGPQAEDHALKAWREWSAAIQHYPFSGNMAMGPIQKGPAHPLFLDLKYVPAQNRGRQFKNDLSWTQPWGPDLALEQLRKLEEGWRSGLVEWEKVLLSAESDLRGNARKEGDVAQNLLCCIRSALNVGRFCQIRDKLWQERTPSVASELIDQLVQVAQAELANSRQALAVVSRDSRLGYANSSNGETIGVARGGINSPGTIEKKIHQVERLLEDDIPDYRRKRGL